MSGPELVGSFGMVASTHWLASAAGMAVLEAGGNAFDAAVACGLVLQVVEPHLNGLGGDAPVIGFAASDDAPFVLCGQGSAPAAATAAAYRDLGLDLVPGTGHLAAVVPGAFGAWLALLDRYGTMRFAQVVSFAIDSARGGFPLLPAAARAIDAVAGLFRDEWPTSAATWLQHGRSPAVGSLVKNPDLATALERLAAAERSAGADRAAGLEAVRRAFYDGFVADAIDGFCSTPLLDSSGQPHAGLLTGADLAAWAPTFEEPLMREFHGVTVCKTGPWGQGPVLLQQLALLEAGDPATLETTDARLVHRVVEGAKLAFADREAWYGDPSFVDVPIETLLGTEYAAARVGLIGSAAIPGLRAGSPDGRRPVLPPDGSASERSPATGGGGTGEPTFAAVPAGLNRTDPAVSPNGATRGDTCHLDVVDRHGNMVSATPSGGWLQSSPTIPGLGFSLPTRAQMFRLDADSPAAIGPGRRPRTTLSPGLALRDGRPILAFGTPGGDQQDQWVVPFLIRHLVQGGDLQESADAPTWHTDDMPSSFFPRERDPDSLTAEATVGDETIADLISRGRRVTIVPPHSLGRITAVAVRTDGALLGAATTRGRQAHAAGR